jgi:Holliday junction resolvase RusA-like endonuclease
MNVMNMISTIRRAPRSPRQRTVAIWRCEVTFRKPGVLQQILISCPVPPSVNKMWLNKGNGARFRNPRASAFRESIARLLFSKGVHRTGRFVRCRILVCNHETIDLDNILKCTLDSLEGVAIDNDRQIRPLGVDYRSDDLKQPYLLIRLRARD